MFTIGEFSKLCGVSARMLRHYNAIGLLSPEKIGENGYRYYAASQLERVRKIERLKAYRFPLAEIAKILPLPPERQREYILRQYEWVKTQALEWQGLAHRMAYDLHSMEVFHMEQNYTVTLVQMESEQVFGLRRCIPCEEKAIGNLIDTAYQQLAANGLRPAGRPPLMAFYGEGFDPENADMEFLIPVEGQAQGVRSLPEVLCVGTTHTGPYATIGGAHDMIAKWLENHPQYEMEPVSYERFLTEPSKITDPQQLKTQVLFPVKMREKA